MIVRIEHDLVRRRVVQGADEQRVSRDVDPLRNQANADLWIVQQAGQQARIDLARIATAGAAMQPAGMGVVDDVGAVPRQQHEPREIGRQRHGPQHGLGRLGREPQDRAAGSRRGAGSFGAGWPRSPSASLTELADIDRSGRLDEGEGRDGRELEAAPGPLGARLQARRLVRSASSGPPERVVRPGFSSTGKRSSCTSEAKPAVRSGQAEKAREPQGLDTGVHGFERAAKDLGAHIDAEGSLERRAAFDRRGPRRRKRFSQARAAPRVPPLPAGWRRRHGRPSA